MPLQYCKRCGVLISSPDPADLCDRCALAASTSQAPPRPAPAGKVQFTCPTCKSLLQLPPVQKRTKVKCPRCQGDFAMLPDGSIEMAAAPQAGILDDLKPRGDLGRLLERVPERTEVLTTVLQSDRYSIHKEEDSAEGPMAPVESPDDEREPPDADGSGEDSSEAPIGLVPEPPPPPEPEAEAPAPRGPLASVQRAREKERRAAQIREERAVRAVEAARHTQKFVARRQRALLPLLKLSALVFLPVVAALVFLVSTTQERGFAGGDYALSRKLADVGEMVTEGVQGWAVLLGK